VVERVTSVDTRIVGGGVAGIVGLGIVLPMLREYDEGQEIRFRFVHLLLPLGERPFLWTTWNTYLFR
jgi:hypothetical protein